MLFYNKKKEHISKKVKMQHYNNQEITEHERRKTPTA